MILVRRYYILTECTDAFWKKQKELALVLNSKSQGQALAVAISSTRDARPAGEPPGINLVEPTPRPTPNASRGATMFTGGGVDTIIEDPIFGGQPVTSSPKSIQEELPPTSAVSQNIGWADAISPIGASSAHTNNFRQRRRGYSFIAPSYPGASIRGMTMVSLGSHPFSSHIEGIEPKYQGDGGFPGFFDVVKKITKRVAPNTYLKIERSMTIQATVPVEVGTGKPIIAGRNSNLRTQSLSDEQLDEIGGLEYRAVTLLCYVIPLVSIFPWKEFFVSSNT
ncbi:hypothetical protein H0H87_011435 [Tephrocybe sp. NHM501043]|nr:hypothetical protein H0H87_011435 [Tephrocybe sp. NHM501043]